LVTPTDSAPRLVAALNAGVRPQLAHEVPSDYYTFAGEIPWHPTFAGEALARHGATHAYRENIRVDTTEIDVEVLAHAYAWEAYHSDINSPGSLRVPSRRFSAQFDLHSAPQGFDQYLPQGGREQPSL
jgi:hypothetical protein